MQILILREIFVSKTFASKILFLFAIRIATLKNMIFSKFDRNKRMNVEYAFYLCHLIYNLYDLIYDEYQFSRKQNNLNNQL